MELRHLKSNKSVNQKKTVLNNEKSADCNETIRMINLPNSSLKIEWLDSEKAASYLCISVQTLRNLTSNGQIPYYKFGRRNRYRRDELDLLLLQNKRGQYGN